MYVKIQFLFSVKKNNKINIEFNVYDFVGFLEKSTFAYWKSKKKIY